MTEENSNKDEKDMKQVLVIMDDVASDANFHQSKAIKKTFYKRKTSQTKYHFNSTIHLSN